VKRSRPGRAPAVRRLLACAGLVLSGVSAMPPGVAAHAIVLQSSPAHEAQLAQAPARVVLRFNSKIEHALSRATIEPAGGRPVPVAMPEAGAAGPRAPDRLVIPLDPLPAGTYVVRYRVLAADGHLTEGALRFTIRAAP